MRKDIINKRTSCRLLQMGGRCLGTALCLVLTAALILGCTGDDGSQKGGRDGVVDKASVDTTYKTYYLNKDHVKIEGVSNIYTAQTPEELIDECLHSLAAMPEDETLESALPEGVQVLSHSYNAGEKQVDIYFNQAYASIPKNEEILVRAAVVKTLTQFDGLIDYVQFFINDEALTENGRPLLMMNSDFVENTKADVKHLNQELISLYFASSDGTQLAAEDVQVHYYKTSPLAKIVVESLISGPMSRNLNPTMSSDVKLLNDVDVVDGVCYVDFNQRFLDKVNDQSFLINVYSVVNSLTELENVSRVQIKIDGSIVAGNDDSVSLDQPLERREDLIAKTTDTPPVVENNAETAESMEAETIADN